MAIKDIKGNVITDPIYIPTGMGEVDLQSIVGGGGGSDNKLDEHLADIATEERHGLRVNQDKDFQYYDGELWRTIKDINFQNYFNNGYESALTGGWVFGWTPTVGFDPNLFSKGETIKIEGSNSLNLVTDKLISLKYISTLHVEWSSEQFNEKGSPFNKLAIVTGGNKSTSNVFEASTTVDGTFEKQITSLDVTALEGNFHVLLSFATSSDLIDREINVFRVWGE